jgi:hypothetical protein
MLQYTPPQYQIDPLKKPGQLVNHIGSILAEINEFISCESTELKAKEIPKKAEQMPSTP